MAEKKKAAPEKEVAVPTEISEGILPEEKNEEESSKPVAENVTDVGTVTSTVISSSMTEATEDKSLVKVRITYPDDYPAKKRFFEDGEIRSVAKETAEEFIKAGIAERQE